MKNPRLAVVAFPGNNCETETVRAAERNGFEATIIRWNQLDLVGNFEAYVLPGGFSFEDRGRSGALAAREPVFDKLREEAQQGKLILGICNGAQMVVESGLIPFENKALPFALADNVRRDKEDHVVGTGFYNEWCFLMPERTDTAFTHQVEGPLFVPFAHGEGRFVSTDDPVIETALAGGSHVAFRYANKEGEVSDQYPVTPNGALCATAAIVNKEGTVMAIMPHPERYGDDFDGDQIFASMRVWIEEGRSPKLVRIGNLSEQEVPEVEMFISGDLCIAKNLIITDNERFSVQATAQNLFGKDVQLDKSIIFEISGTSDLETLMGSGLLHNPNKEQAQVFEAVQNQYLVKCLTDDQALHLADQLTERLKTPVTVNIYKAWDFGDTDQGLVDKVLANGLLCNPNSAQLFKA